MSKSLKRFKGQMIRSATVTPPCDPSVGIFQHDFKVDNLDLHVDDFDEWELEDFRSALRAAFELIDDGPCIVTFDLEDQEQERYLDEIGDER